MLSSMWSILPQVSPAAPELNPAKKKSDIVFLCQWRTDGTGDCALEVDDVLGDFASRLELNAGEVEDAVGFRLPPHKYVDEVRAELGEILQLDWGKVHSVMGLMGN